MASARIISANGLMLLDPNDGSGARWPIADNDPGRASFGVFIPNVTPAATPTDILMIQGSASKTIRVRSIIITGTATVASNVQVIINRRATANTGGTSVAQTVVNRDRNDDPVTATVSVYSVNPTALGTSAGVADGGRLNLAPAANGSIDRLLLQYGWFNDKAPVLRGVNDFLCVGLGGAALPAGGSFDFNVVFSEE